MSGRTPALKSRIARFREHLDQLGRSTWSKIRHVSENLAPGEFSSPYRFPSGLERDVPRTFTIDDDFALLHTGAIPPTLACASLPQAILRGDMRANQSIHYGDAVFTVIVDLSRSMLAGCLRAAPGDSRASKLESLYGVVATYLRLAETAGFDVRVIAVTGIRVDTLRPRTVRNFAQQAMVHMGDRLLATFERTETRPDSEEPFLLKPALRLTLNQRHRGVVAVVSDFLDPFRGYREALSQVLGKHRMILIDVATPLDRDYPVPEWWEVEARRTPSREGARHLEEGTVPRLSAPDQIREWNRRRQDDRRALEGLTRLHGARLTTCHGRDLARLALDALTFFNSRHKV